MRQIIHLPGLEATRLQAIVNGLYRKGPGRLVPVESFLGRRGDDLALAHQCRRRIESLRDAVTPAREVGEFPLLEADAVMKTADADNIHNGFGRPAYFNSARTFFASSTNFALAFSSRAWRRASLLSFFSLS